MSIIFSINGRREFQKISKLSGRLLFKEGRLSGLIDAIDIEEGSFAGLLSFNFHESMREGLVQSKVEKLLFKPEVQKLLGFHPEKGTEVYGKGQWGPEFPFRWQGSIGLPRVNRGGLSFESVSYKTQWSDDEWNGQVTASRLEVDRKSSWHRVMTNIYLGEHDPDEKIQWKNIEANFRVTEQGFLWERSQAQDANQDIVFSSAGSHKGHQATGFIEVDFPALKQLKWNLAGDFQKPTLTPSPEMLTSLAKTRPDLQAPIAMEILWQGGELMGSPFGVPRALGTPPPKQEP